MENITGITIEKDLRGNARYARIDLRKYGAELKEFFKEKGIEIDKVKLTPKLKRSIEQAKNGEYKEGNTDNFWQ